MGRPGFSVYFYFTKVAGVNMPFIFEAEVFWFVGVAWILGRMGA